MISWSDSGVDLASLRRDVALANRIVHRLGLVSAFGHISSRIPGTDTFLIPTRRSPGLAHEDRLLTLDFDGNILEGHGTPNTEFWIHARTYAARPEVGSVGHVHAVACVILGQIGVPFRVLHNSGAYFWEGVPVFDRVGLVRSREVGDEVAAALGNHRAMFLRGHGANVVADSVRRTAAMACFLEEGADIQVRALAAAGGDVQRLRAYTSEEGSATCAALDNPGVLDRAWEYYAELAEGAFEGGDGR